MAEYERRVWASVHGVRACSPHMAGEDIYASDYSVLVRWHRRHDQPVYVVGFEVPSWLPEGVRVVHV